jgi:hypothetical protein
VAALAGLLLHRLLLLPGSSLNSPSSATVALLSSTPLSLAFYCITFFFAGILYYIFYILVLYY